MIDTKVKIDADLQLVRQSIDHIDADIQKLLVQRAEKIKEISHIKQQEANSIFYRPEREAAVLKKIMSRDCGALPPKEVAKIFREIMSACLALQKTMQIAFLGPKGTYSQAAALKHFGCALHEVFCNNISEVFSKVAKGDAYYGVVPIENTLGGLVEISMNEFIDSTLSICGEVTLEIKQCLLRKIKAEKTESDSIEKIYSHQQSLLQCQTWLSKNYPNAKLISVASNALAAEYAKNEKGSAAIAGEQCAAIYDLEIIARNIENSPNNTTRFLIIGQQHAEKTGDDRTSLLAKVDDAPGALEKLINPLARNQINITMIRSMPAAVYEKLDNNNKLNTSYYFFLDLDCHFNDAGFISAKHELEAVPITLKLLGSYPKAVI